MQDFNANVIRASTIATFRLNGLLPAGDDERRRVRFLCGDWRRVSAQLLSEGAVKRMASAGGRCEDAEGGDFDIVLSADTLYSPEASGWLWQLVREQLRPGGTALIAAKLYYFGVGGSVAGFKALVATDPRFSCSTLRTFDDGTSNRRECFAVRRDQSAAIAASSSGTTSASTGDAGANGDGAGTSFRFSF